MLKSKADANRCVFAGWTKLLESEKSPTASVIGFPDAAESKLGRGGDPGKRGEAGGQGKAGGRSTPVMLIARRD